MISICFQVATVLTEELFKMNYCKYVHCATCSSSRHNCDGTITFMNME